MFRSSATTSPHEDVPRLFLLLALICGLQHVSAQHLSGTIEERAAWGRTLVLSVVRGAEHHALDSVLISADGKFTFPKRQGPEGFHQLALNDSDRVDLILSPEEAEVVLEFASVPLQEHIRVLRSDLNQGLWEYKLVSRESQAQLAAIQDERRSVSPTDMAASLALTEREAQVQQRRTATMDRIIARDSTAYFARVILADRRLMAAVPLGAESIGNSFAWADPGLMHSSIYPKAVMAYLQKLPFEVDGGLRAGADSILLWTSPDTACWSYARTLLVRIFNEYGPEDMVQYLVDRYVAGPDARLPADRSLLHLVSERMKVAIGAKAPDVWLRAPSTGDSTRLHDVLSAHRYTLLFFYSSTCDHCHQQMPGLRALYAEHERADLTILGLSLDTDLEEFQDTVRDQDLPWPGYSELNGWGSKVAKAFQVKATPTMLLLDASGTIVAKPYDHAELRSILGNLLE